MSSAYPVEKLRRAILHLIGGRAVHAVARAALVLMVVRLLPVEDYGAYMLIVGIAEMFLQLCSFGLLPVGQRFLPQAVESSARRDTYRFVAGITLLQLLSLALVCTLLWFLWDRILPNLGFSSTQIDASRPGLLLLLLMPMFRFTAELLDALLEQGRSQIANALVPLGRLAGLLALLASGTEITLGRILLLDCGIVLGCLVLAWVLVAGSLRKLPEPADPKPLPVRSMARHAWHMAAVQVMGSAHAPGALRLVLAGSLGIVEAGLFAFLQSLQRLIGRYLPSVMLRGLLRPMLISRVAGARGMDYMEQSTGLLLKSNLIMVAGAAMLAFIAGDWLVELASGGRFVDTGYSLLLIFLVLGVSSTRLIVEMLLQVLDQTRVLRATSMLLPLSLAFVWLAAHFGLNAAIAASALGTALANSIGMWRLRVVTGRFQVDWRGIGSIVLPMVVAGLLGRALLDLTGPWVAMATGSAVLALLLFASKPFASMELQMADRGLGNIARRALEPFSRKMPAA